MARRASRWGPAPGAGFRSPSTAARRAPTTCAPRWRWCSASPLPPPRRSERWRSTRWRPHSTSSSSPRGSGSPTAPACTSAPCASRPAGSRCAGPRRAGISSGSPPIWRPTTPTRSGPCGGRSIWRPSAPRGPRWRTCCRRPTRRSARPRGRWRRCAFASITRPQGRWWEPPGAAWSSSTPGAAIRTGRRARSSPRPTICASAPARWSGQERWSPPRRSCASGSSSPPTPACCSIGRSRSIPRRPKRSRRSRRSAPTPGTSPAWPTCSSESWRSRRAARASRRRSSRGSARSTTGTYRARPRRVGPTSGSSRSTRRMPPPGISWRGRNLDRSRRRLSPLLRLLLRLFFPRAPGRCRRPRRTSRRRPTWCRPLPPSRRQPRRIRATGARRGWSRSQSARPTR